MKIFNIFFFFQAEDGIRDHCVTGFRRVLFRSPGEPVNSSEPLLAFHSHQAGTTTRGRRYNQESSWAGWRLTRRCSSGPCDPTSLHRPRHLRVPGRPAAPLQEQRGCGPPRTPLRAFPRVSTILSGCGACARPRFGCRFHPVPNPFAV